MAQKVHEIPRITQGEHLSVHKILGEEKNDVFVFQHKKKKKGQSNPTNLHRDAIMVAI